MRHPFLFPTCMLAAAAILALPRAGGTKPEAPSLRISPDRTSLQLGEGKQFRAQIKGLKGTVRWSVEGADSGSITSSGLYQAPTMATTPATVRVVATVEEKPELRAEASVFLSAVSLDVSPMKVKLATTETQQFRAKVRGVDDQRVIWSVEGGPISGRISESGFFAAPPAFSTPGTITIRATSAADPSKSATAVVEVEEVGIRIKEKEVVLRHGQSHRFEAKVTGSPNQDVEWSVLGEGQGQISTAGLYTTPPTMATPCVVTIVGRAAADPTKTAQVQVRIEPIQVIEGRDEAPAKKKKSPFHRVASAIYRTAAPKVVRLLLPFDPIDLVVRGPNFKGKSGKRYVPLGGLAVFHADVRNTNNDRITWELEGERLGELTEDGVYYAPEQVTTPQVIQIRATSVADPTKSHRFTLHIPPVVVQAEEPEQACPLGSALQLAAKVENTENDRILWSVEGGEQFGTVSPTGLYHPPSRITTPGVVRVRAASEADPSKFALIQVRIPEVSVDVSPQSSDVKPGESIRLKTRVRGCAGNGEVEWKLTPEVGTISPDGVYRAPEDGGPQVVQVSAILKGDPTKVATATLKLRGKD